MRNTLFPVICFLVLTTLSSGLPKQAPPQDNAQTTTGPIYDLRRAGENGIAAPKAIYQPFPEYTEKARKKKIRGTVLMSIVVTPDGTVREPKLVRSLDNELDKQALDTVSKWKFTPATKDGQPVSVRIEVEVSFNVR